MPPKPALRAVIFDLDGTLLSCPYDFAAMRQAVQQAAMRFGVSKELLAGLGILEAIDCGAQQLDAEQRERFREQALAEVQRLEAEGAKNSFVLAGAKELLHWLKARGLRVAIITRNAENVAGDLIRRAQFDYDVFLARESVVRAKPDPAHLQAALAQVGYDNTEAIMVGDHIWDVACAAACDLACIGVASGASSAADLKDAGAVIVLDSIAALPEWLEENFYLPERKAR